MPSRTRKLTTPPSSIVRSWRTTSATRRSRSVWPAVVTAARAAASQDSSLTPITSVTRYTLSAITGSSRRCSRPVLQEHRPVVGKPAARLLPLRPPPQLDPPRDFTDVEGALGRRRRAALDVAVAEREAAAVAGALDGLAVDRADAERTAAVRAAVVHREDVLTDAGHEHGRVADDGGGGLGAEIGGGQRVGPLVRAGIEDGLIDAYALPQGEMAAEVAGQREQRVGAH